MAKKKKLESISKKTGIKKRISIDNSLRSKPRNKKRGWKKYHGQGR